MEKLRVRSFSIGLMISFLSELVSAGTMGAGLDFAGLSVGLGAGYTNTNLNFNTTVTMVSSFTPVVAHFKNENTKSSLSPVVNLSYLYPAGPDWYLGAKALYKYVGTQQPSFSWTGTFSDGTYQSANFHTKLVQELSLLVQGGYQFGNWITYLGLGAGMVNISNQLRGDLLPSTSIIFQYSDIIRSNVIWGGAGQIGFAYLLPNRFMVDISYNLIATPLTNLAAINFYTPTAGMYTQFAPRAGIIEQGINITVNKYINLF